MGLNQKRKLRNRTMIKPGQIRIGDVFRTKNEFYVVVFLTEHHVEVEKMKKYSSLGRATYGVNELYSLEFVTNIMENE